MIASFNNWVTGANNEDALFDSYRDQLSAEALADQLTEELEVLPGEYLESDKFARIFGSQIEVNDPVLLCEYFNGRKLVYRKYKHSPLNDGGKDACPSFLRPRQ